MVFRRTFRYILLPALTLSIILFASWGFIGHKTVATIASNHLTPKAQAMVKDLLGDTTMADVASWADQVVRDPAYKETAPQHYVNVRLGLSYDQFAKEIVLQAKQNVYSAVDVNRQILMSKKATRDQKRIALKFLIHFVGDLHQPMHVSRFEDKGGNNIQLQYEGKGTNLHSLWDGKLIGTEGKSFDQMAVEYDTASKKDIKQWQADPVMKWLWESYQISSKLYVEIEQNNKLDSTYYNSHIGIVHDRMQKAGIRLAGLLNEVAGK